MKKLKIDIVHDIVCPWCAIGYANFAKALDGLGTKYDIDVVWQPFQLRPDMAAQGQNLNEYLMMSYGIDAAQAQDSKAQVCAAAKASGVEMKFADDARMVNTLASHILLHWAATHNKQTILRLAVSKAYYAEGLDISDAELLAILAESVGLDKAEAAAALLNETYKKSVLEQEALYKSRGIRSVPSFVINDARLLAGGQSVEGFEQGLRDLLEG